MRLSRLALVSRGTAPPLRAAQDKSSSSKGKVSHFASRAVYQGKGGRMEQNAISHAFRPAGWRTHYGLQPLIFIMGAWLVGCVGFVGRLLFNAPDFNFSKNERPHDYWVNRQSKILNLGGVDHARAGDSIPLNWRDGEAAPPPKDEEGDGEEGDSKAE